MNEKLVCTINNIQIVKTLSESCCKKLCDNGKVKETYKRVRKQYKALSPKGQELYMHDKFKPVKDFALNSAMYAGVVS
jgi:hypothetical protein